MSGQREFSGQLYKADPVTKAWSVMCKGLTTLTLLPIGNKRWRMVASKGTEKVLDQELGSTFKHRVKDTFVQWQQKSRSGASETHGFRTKELITAQELGAVLDSIVSELEKEDTLTILLPDQNRSILKFDKSTTMLQVLKKVAEKHHFDVTQYALATPPEPPSDNPSKLKAAMTVQQLKRLDVMVVSRKKPPKPPQEETTPLEVFLPNDTSITVNVVLSITLKELLILICSKSSLDPSIHAFDLPIANPPDSLKLQQLKITSILLIQKEMPASSKHDQTKESANSQPKGTLKPRITNAPPPPKVFKPQQLTAGVMKQLKDKMAASSNEGTEEVDHPSPVLQSKRSPGIQRATPPPNRRGEDTPPVAQKSSRKAPPPPLVQKKSSTATATDSDDNTPKHSRKITVTRRAPPPPKPLQVKHKSIEEVDSGVQGSAGKGKMSSSPRLPGRMEPTSYKKGPSVSPLATRRIMASDIKQYPMQVQSSPSPSAFKKTSVNRAPGKAAPPPPTSRKPPSKEQLPHPPSQPAKVTISPSKEDGGQLLIVRASPSERRRVVSLPGSLVFKLPPPPPKGPGFHSLKRTKKRDDPEPAVEDKLLEEDKDVAEKETRELLEEKEKESIDEKESEEEESDVEEEKNDTENDTDLDKSTATSDSDSFMGYHVDSATKLHKEDQSPTSTPPPEQDELFDVQVDGDALLDQPPSVWHHPAVVSETLSSADSDSYREESSEDEEEEDDNDGEEQPEIVLLSVQKASETSEPELGTDAEAVVDPAVPTMLEIPPPPPPPPPQPQVPVDPVFQVALDQLSNLSVAEAIAREEEAQREKNSAELNELDTMLTSLRSLIADTCEIGGKSDGDNKSAIKSSTNTVTSIKTPPPPPDVTLRQVEEPSTSLGKPSTEESTAELDRSSSPSPPPSPPSPPPSPPPPPPLSPPPLDDELESEEPVTQTHKPKPLPPTKPKPVRKPAGDESSELLAKLRRRREKSDVPPAPSKTDESPPVTAPQPVPAESTGQTPAGDNVQMQLQFLQQQVLQQQVMQLQQQFQTFQQAMSSGMPQQQQQQQQQQMMGLMQQMQAAMAQQPSAGYPPAPMMFGQQPLMTAPSTQPVPMVQPVMVPPTTGQTPYMMAAPQLQPTQQLPIMSTGPVPSSATLSQPFGATVGTTPAQPLAQQQQQPTASVTPPLATVPATGEQQAPAEVAATPIQKERKTSEADTRYDAMGSAVKKYDDIMQQVRAVDFNELLKPPEDTEEDEEETHSSYTGMTAALLEAMQERRKQITADTSFESNADTSLRQDAHNDSTGWES